MRLTGPAGPNVQNPQNARETFGGLVLFSTRRFRCLWLSFVLFPIPLTSLESLSFPEFRPGASASSRPSGPTRVETVWTAGRAGGSLRRAHGIRPGVWRAAPQTTDTLFLAGSRRPCRGVCQPSVAPHRAGASHRGSPEIDRHAPPSEYRPRAGCDSGMTIPATAKNCSAGGCGITHESVNSGLPWSEAAYSVFGPRGRSVNSDPHADTLRGKSPGSQILGGFIFGWRLSAVLRCGPINPDRPASPFSFPRVCIPSRVTARGKIGPTRR